MPNQFDTRRQYGVQGAFRARTDGSVVNAADGIRDDGTQMVALKEVGQVKGFGSFHYAAPFENLVIIPDVATTIDDGQSSDPSAPVKVIDFKKIGIFADFKDATDVTLRFEVSPSGIGDEWYLLEEKEFNDINEPNQYFLLAGGADILANYARVTVKNDGASQITMPFIRAVMRG